MYSENREYGKIGEKEKELIRDRKENFLQISDNSKSLNRFQIIVSGLAVSLIGFLVSNEIISFQGTISNYYTFSALTSLVSAIWLSFITDHKARKHASRQSELLFDDYFYNSITTDEQLSKKIRRDKTDEDVLRWMESVSIAATIVFILLFLLGIVNTEPMPLIILSIALLPLTLVLGYMLSLLGVMVERLLIDVNLLRQENPIWKIISEKIRSYTKYWQDK